MAPGDFPAPGLWSLTPGARGQMTMMGTQWVFISVFILIAITLGLGGEENSVDTMQCNGVSRRLISLSLSFGVRRLPLIAMIENCTLA